MKSSSPILLSILLLSLFSFGQTTWTGPKMTFEKQGSDDPLIAANQDRITDLVWLTRGSDNVLFNAKTQTGAPTNGYDSPEDTRWAEGTTADLNSLTFSDFKSAAPKTSTGAVRVREMAGKDYVLHLVTDNIYIDVKILTWETRSQGAGFSYERSTNQNLSSKTTTMQPMRIYPNPAAEVIQISGLSTSTGYSIYTILGAKETSGILEAGGHIKINRLKNGVYLLALDSGTSFTFLKK